MSVFDRRKEKSIKGEKNQKVYLEKLGKMKGRRNQSSSGKGRRKGVKVPSSRLPNIEEKRREEQISYF